MAASEVVGAGTELTGQSCCTKDRLGNDGRLLLVCFCFVCCCGVSVDTASQQNRSAGRGPVTKCRPVVVVVTKTATTSRRRARVRARAVAVGATKRRRKSISNLASSMGKRKSCEVRWTPSSASCTIQNCPRDSSRLDTKIAISVGVCEVGWVVGWVAL